MQTGITFKRKEQSTYLIRRFVILFKIRMRKTFFNSNSSVRIKGKHPVQKVESSWICIWIQSIPGHLRFQRKRLKVTPGLFIDDTVKIFLSRRSKNIQDKIQLIQVMFSWENRSIGDHFCQNASNGPNINRFGVSLTV